MRSISNVSVSSDWIEEQEFSKLHQIVLGLLSSSLEKAIADDPSSIDKTDAIGHSPLSQAAAREDDHAVETLLDHNANSNVTDMYLLPLIYYAADGGHTLCVKLLLKYLLTYGDQVDSTGVDKNPALNHASRKDYIRFAILLLDSGADVNAAKINQRTPVTTAIMYDGHGFFNLLLERWEEFSSCPYLEPLHLIEISALYADIETVKLLAEIDHKKLRYAAKYLLLVLNRNPTASTSKRKESRTEKGHFGRASALAILYESEKIMARHQPGQRCGSMLITLMMKAIDSKIYKECISTD